MSNGAIIKRRVMFSHRSHQSTVDIVPMGFRLFAPIAYVEEIFFSQRLLESDLLLLCLTDTVFLEDEVNETPVQEVRPFLRAHYERIQSQPLRWRFQNDPFEDEQRIEFEFSVRWEASKKLADRIELLEACLRQACDDALPRWFMALKDDVERGVPAEYHVEVACAEGAITHRFVWSSWRDGRCLIGLEPHTRAYGEEESDADEVDNKA